MAETDLASPSQFPPLPAELSTELFVLREICDVCASPVATNHTGNIVGVTEELVFEFCLLF